MAVAYAQTQSRFFGGAELTKHSTLVSNNTSAESSNDSDDDYDYVATLAEQIAHAMLDDDDSKEDESFREQVVYEGCPQFRKNVSCKTDVHDTALDSWSNYTDLSMKIAQERTSSQSLSSPMSVPFCHSSVFFNRSHDHAKTECSNCSVLPASSPGEAGAVCAALEVSERSSGGRGRVSSVSRQSNVAALPRSSTTLTATESFRLQAIAVPMVEGTETIVNATKFPFQQAGSDGVYHVKLNHWQDRSWPCSNGRSRNNAGRRRCINRDEKGARASFCYYSVQASSPVQPVPPELPERTGMQGFCGSGRKGTTGTGVFLPRANSTSSNHRRKSEGGLAVTKAAHSPKSFLEIIPKVNVTRYGGEYPRKCNSRSELTQ